VVVRAVPDGYTLLQVAPPNAINATVYDKLSFNFIHDIAPVAGIVRYPYVMVVNSSFPTKTVPEFIAYAKANPGKINMASAGNGSVPHVAGELFKMMTGIEMLHVPYRGGYFSDCQKRTSSDCFDDHELDGLLNGNIGAVLPPTVTSYLAVHMGQTPCKCYCKMADEPANSRHYCGRGPHHTSADEHKLRDDDVWLRPMLEMWR
jgi:hypothetical protein